MYEAHLTLDVFVIRTKRAAVLGLLLLAHPQDLSVPRTASWFVMTMTEVLLTRRASSLLAAQCTSFGRWTETLLDRKADGQSLVGSARTILDRDEADGPLVEAPSLIYWKG